MNYIFSNQTDKRHQNRDSTNYLVFVACHRINTALTFFHPFLAILEKLTTIMISNIPTGNAAMMVTP